MTPVLPTINASLNATAGGLVLFGVISVSGVRASSKTASTSTADSRWALPAWLYFSVIGVVVPLVVYHL